MLPQEVHSALSQLLVALSAADNNVRSQAETQLNDDWVPNRRDVLLMGLAEQLQGAEDATVSDPVVPVSITRVPIHIGMHERETN